MSSKYDQVSAVTAAKLGISVEALNALRDKIDSIYMNMFESDDFAFDMDRATTDERKAAVENEYSGYAEEFVNETLTREGIVPETYWAVTSEEVAMIFAAA